MTTMNKFLLTCGIMAAVIYVFSDIYSSFLWKDYNYTGQSVSELRAVEAPTRGLLLIFLYIYSVLEISFGFGILKSSNHRKMLYKTGILIICLGVVDFIAPFFPMHLRENIQITGRTFSDTMHIIITTLTVILLLMIIGFASVTNIKWFRIYSYVTIFALLAGGFWASLDVPLIEANLPTPGLGIKERLNIYGYMLWMAIFAVVLLRDERKFTYSGK